MTRTIIPDLVPEGATWRFKGILKDEQGQVIQGSALATLTLTLKDRDTGTILNGVNAVNILNTGRGVVDEAGLLRVTLTPADNVMQDSAKDLEAHVMVLRWTWGATAEKAGAHEVEFSVKNL
jgi:hypothetical protein